MCCLGRSVSPQVITLRGQMGRRGLALVPAYAFPQDKCPEAADALPFRGAGSGRNRGSPASWRGVSPDLGLLNLSVLLWEVQTIAPTSPTGMEGGAKAYRSCWQRLDVLCKQVSLVE